MTQKSTVTFSYDSYNHPSYYSSSDDSLPAEHHIEFKIPADSSNLNHYFNLFRSFMLAIGYEDRFIASSACSLVFNEFRSEEEMQKIANEHDIYLAEEHLNIVNELNQKIESQEKEILDLKAKLSRYQNPNTEQYTDAEMTAMAYSKIHD